MSEKIYINRDGNRIELKGAELEAFLEQREKDQAEWEAEQSRIEAAELEKQQKRESAVAKLKALGLTDDEVDALLGN
jgi:hypothetical protein